VRVLPDGKIHGSAELGPIPNARALSLVYEVRKKAAELEEVLSPDGAASVPYILFLVRPDGIRHYYQARTLLESTRIAFGYELVGQDWVIDAHESQKPSRVEGSTDIARAKPRARTGQRSANQPQDEDDDLYVWPNNALKGADGPAQTGQIVELPQGQGARVLTALNDRDGTEAFGPGDLLEPPMRKVTDPRRPTGTGNDPDGTEIITGQNRGGGDVNRPGQGPAGRTPTPAVMQSNRPGSAVGSETGGARVAEPPMPGSSAGAGSLAVRQPPVPGANSRSPFAPGTAGANGSGPSEHLIASVAGSQGLQNGSTSVAGVPDAAGVQNAAQPSSGRPGSNRLGQVADQLLGSGSGLHSTDTAAGTAAGATASGQPGTAAGATASGQPGTATGATGAVGGSSGTPVGAGSGMGQSRAGTGHSPSQGASSPSGTGSSSGSPGASNSGGFGFGAPSPDATNSNGQGESSWLSTPGGSGSESGLPPRVSEEWLDIVIACQSDGLTIQPGGYRLTLEKLQSTSLFNDRLKSIANRHGRDDRGRIRRPRLRYVVESGGQDSFWQARRQSSFIGMDWPATIQLADSISWDRWLFEEKTR